MHQHPPAPAPAPVAPAPVPDDAKDASKSPTGFLGFSPDAVAAMVRSALSATCGCRAIDPRPPLQAAASRRQGPHSEALFLMWLANGRALLELAGLPVPAELAPEPAAVNGPAPPPPVCPQEDPKAEGMPAVEADELRAPPEVQREEAPRGDRPPVEPAEEREEVAPDVPQEEQGPLAAAEEEEMVEGERPESKDGHGAQRHHSADKAGESSPGREETLAEMLQRIKTTRVRSKAPSVPAMDVRASKPPSPEQKQEQQPAKGPKPGAKKRVGVRSSVSRCHPPAP